LNETVDPGFAGLGLNNAKFNTNSVNLTGRVSYRMDINDNGLNFVPTAGLSYSRTSGSTLNFTGGEKLQLNSFNSIIGFAGGTIAKTVISPAGDAGTTYFMSGNYYHDFAKDRTSVFTDAGGGVSNITSGNIGGFGELSVGMNYVRILEDGPAGAKQLNTNIRADARVGKNVKKGPVNITGPLSFKAGLLTFGRDKIAEIIALPRFGTLEFRLSPKRHFLFFDADHMLRQDDRFFLSGLYRTVLFLPVWQ
jgi:hypothetical protein